MELPGADHVTNPCAADRFAVEGNGREAMDNEFQLRSEGAEQGDVSAPFVTKGEGAAHADAVDVAEVAGESADEALGRLLAEWFVELDQQRRVGAQGFDGAQFLRQRINQR